MASKLCGFGAFRCYLMLLNVFYIAISIFLIGLVVVARTFAYQIPSLFVVIGVAVVASILFFLAIIGIVATVKHHQVMLFFYMVLLGLCGVTLFAVSVAALALRDDVQEAAFKISWKALSVKEKTDIQNSLNCCGFNNLTRHAVDNGTLSDCNEGHPFCTTTTLFDQCCRKHNVSAVGPASPHSLFNSCWVEYQCQDCHPCYSSWESTVTAGIKAAGAFGLICSFTQIIGIVMTFRYRNLKDPNVNPSALL